MAVSSSFAILLVLCSTSGESRRTESNILEVIHSFDEERKKATTQELRSLESNEATRVHGNAPKANSTSPVKFWLLLQEKVSGDYPHELYKGVFELASNGVVPLDDNTKKAKHLDQKPSVEGQEFDAVKCEWVVGETTMALDFSQLELEEAEERLSLPNKGFGREDIGDGFLEAMKAMNIPAGGSIVVRESTSGKISTFVELLKMLHGRGKSALLDEIQKFVSQKYAERKHMGKEGCCRGSFNGVSYDTKFTWSECYYGFITDRYTHHWIPKGCRDEALLKQLSDFDPEKWKGAKGQHYMQKKDKWEEMSILNYWNGEEFDWKENSDWKVNDYMKKYLK